ncbi:MAG TPA: ferredoxin [Gaiellaceae bacterium]|jgi:ferredoxin
MFRVDIDSDLCSGFGSCVDDAPEIFRLDDSGTAALLVPETDDKRVLKAAVDCPMAAIAVFDAESGELVS